MITASEDLKLETKPDENSEIEEKMKAKLNVEMKEDTGQGSLDRATPMRLSPSLIITTYKSDFLTYSQILLTIDWFRSVDS